MNTRAKGLGELITSSVIAAVLYLVYVREFFNEMISKSIDIHMILFLVLTYYILLLITLIKYHKLERYYIHTFYYVYIVMLITLFFSKDVSTQIGYINTFNLNISEIRHSISDPFNLLVLVMNVVLIVPLGWICRRYSALIKLMMPVVMFSLVEYIQFKNEVGIFDINDIILNTLGFYIGAFVLKVIIKK